MHNRCSCLKPLSIRQVVKALVDEASEFVSKPSLVGSLINQAAFDLVATSRYNAKVTLRMKQHGCIRSSRHLVDGRYLSSLNQSLELIKS